MAGSYPELGRRFFFLASLVVLGTAASCSVYGGDPEPRNDAGSGGTGGTVDSGRSGAGGVPDAGTGGSTGGSGGSTGGAAGSTGGDAGAGGGGGSSGTSGTGGGGTGGSGVDGSAGAGGNAGKGGAAGTAGTGGAAGTSGAGGAAGVGGTAGTGGAAGTSGTDGAAGVGGTAGTGGAAGTGGVAGASGTGGTAGTAGTGGTGGTADAAPDVPPPGAVFAVGSFTKITTGTAQTVSHTLGQTPKALLLWTSGKTNETASSGFLFGLGVSDGTTSFASAFGVRDAVTTSVSGRRTAAKVITLVQYDQTIVAEADLTTSTSTTFALNWTTNDAGAYVIHYLAIGGPQVMAKVVNWQATTAPGAKAVPGIGFMPETVLHFYAGGAATAAPPAVSGNGVFGLGAMDKGGAQWSNMVGDTSNANPSVSSRAQKTDSALFMTTDAPSLAITKEATFASMDSGGFTVNFTANSSSANQSQIFSLALAGVKAKAGSFTKSVAAQPASQAITTPQFKPGAVFFSSYQSTAQTASVAAGNSRLGFGASDGTHEGSSAIAVADAVSPTNVDGVDKTSKAFMKLDNTTMTIDAEADMTSLDALGFTLNWTKNDAVATQVCFLALGAP